MGAREALLKIVLAVFAFAAASANAQAPTVAPTELQQLRIHSEEQERVIANLMAQIVAGRDYSLEQRGAIITAKAKAVQSYYDSQASYNQNGDRLRAYQQQVFAWQLMAGNWLLGVVVLLSVSGVAFAGYEMVASRRLVRGNVAALATAGQTSPPPLEGAAAPAAAIPNVSTITIEPTKVQITSAVIGIIILTLSLGFLYLFLRQVYSVDVIDLTDTGRSKLVSTRCVQPAAAETAKSDSSAEQK